MSAWEGRGVLVTGASSGIGAALARDIRRQLERGDFELYMPHAMRDAVATRDADVAKSVEFMAGWYRSGRHR